MTQSALRVLMRRLDAPLTRALERGVLLCRSRTHREMAVSHLLLSLLDLSDRDFMTVLEGGKVSPEAVRDEILDGLGRLPGGHSGRIGMGPLLVELLQDAWVAASVGRGEETVRSLALLEVFLERPSFFLPECRTDSFDRLGEGLPALWDRVGDPSVEGAPVPGRDPRPEADFLSEYCEDITEKARNNLLDPVFGRDSEIRQMIDILSRRRKNNPILVGDPGVGKTAVVEGLALRIVRGEVPPPLAGVRLLGLDLASLEAGAGVRGEFERRMKALIGAVRASPDPAILFLDEAHTLVGGGARGGDAANLLKPVLARGEFRTIAATTWSEYKKYFEKDAALERRFQPVRLSEPSVETTVLILRGLRERYEKAHGVAIADDALSAAAELSHRYITGRCLPDKAVDLLDTSAARATLSLSSRPEEVERLAGLVQALERESAGLIRDREDGRDVDGARIDRIGDERRQALSELARAEERWMREKEAVREYLDRRTEGSSSGPDRSGALGERRRMLREIQGDSPMIHFEVDRETVGKVVSDWTGIPLGKLLRRKAEAVARLDETLRERVRGQDHALARVSEVIRNATVGLRDPRRPLGIFLLVGPSGVGKTETALGVADLLFGDEKAAVVVNMSEFQEKHCVSRLIGSPPGYVGYGEGGVLTEAVRRRPHSLVLLDEVAKAPPDILHIFYQVFDKGVLADGEGKEVDFSNTVIFLTSNLASDMLEQCGGGLSPSGYAEAAERIRPSLVRQFKAALLGRMTVVPYLPLEEEHLAEIVRIKLDRLCRTFLQSGGSSLSFSGDLVAHVARQCRVSDAGARNIDAIVQHRIFPELSRDLADRIARGALPPVLRVGIREDGGLEVLCGGEGEEEPSPEEGGSGRRF